MRVTDFAPNNGRILPALLNLKQAAEYLGVSYWTARDYVLNGTLSVVELPATRVNAGKRRGVDGKLPPERVIVQPDDPRVRGRRVRRVLVRRAELDQFIAQHTHRLAPYDSEPSR